jgi:hypothetical protein
MIKMHYKGMIIKAANQTGGKAGKGFNKTSTIQVIEPHSSYSLMKKHFRFEVGNQISMKAAFDKAIAFIDAMPAPAPSGGLVLRPAWHEDAKCQTDFGSSFYVPDGVCSCGTRKHHYHCPGCGGVTQIG